VLALSTEINYGTKLYFSSSMGMTSGQWTFQTMQHVSVLRTAALDDQCNAAPVATTTINTTLGLPRSNYASLFTTNSSISTERISIKPRQKTVGAQTANRVHRQTRTFPISRVIFNVNRGWVAFTREEPVDFSPSYILVPPESSGAIFHGTLLHSKIFVFFLFYFCLFCLLCRKGQN
jgi:hypothetical protein